MNEEFNMTTDQSDDWRTPDWLFKALDTEFAFDFDAAADTTNAKCAAWTDDIEGHKRAGTMLPAPTVGKRNFCNPPYSNIDPFVERALAGCDLWVFILPVRTRSAWFERLRLDSRVEFRWLRKRIAFDPPPGVEPSNPRMDTFIAVVRAL